MASFPGFSTPAASTEVPLEMLASCHIRIQHQCNTLQRLSAHVQQHGTDEQARQAAKNIMRYFDTAAVEHHADEEQDLFPALLDSVSDVNAASTRKLIDRLCHEHRQLEAEWAKLRKTLQRIAAGENVTLQHDDVNAFVTHYTNHLQLEDKQLLPLANQLLGEQHIEQIGRAMRTRRGINLV